MKGSLKYLIKLIVKEIALKLKKLPYRNAILVH